jgi:two-component sensor histidine kinase
MSITSTAWSREAFVLIRELNHRHVNYLQLIAITLAWCAGQPTSTQVQTKLADVVNRLHAHASYVRMDRVDLSAVQAFWISLLVAAHDQCSET